MELFEIMDELKSLGTERTKKMYISNGAKEPVFGVTISAMKLLKEDYALNVKM